MSRSRLRRPRRTVTSVRFGVSGGVMRGTVVVAIGLATFAFVLAAPPRQPEEGPRYTLNVKIDVGIAPYSRKAIWSIADAKTGKTTEFPPLNFSASLGGNASWCAADRSLCLRVEGTVDE